MEMKEMKYLSYEDFYNPLRRRRKGNIEVLFSNTHRGFTYHILNVNNLHMCAYIEVEDESIRNLIVDKDCDLGIHWGVSYDNFHPIINKKVIGWDYAHYEDCTPYCLDDDLHKWTTEEVDVECRNVIDNLVNLIDTIDKHNQLGYSSFLVETKE